VPQFEFSLPLLRMHHDDTCLVWLCRRNSDHGIRTATIIFSINNATLDSSFVDYLVAPVAIWPPSNFNRLCFGYTNSIRTVYRLHMSLAFTTVRQSEQKTCLPVLADLILVMIQLPVFGVCPLTVIPHLVGLVVDLSDEILRVEVRILVKATQFEACFALNVILASKFIISFHRPHVEYGVSLSSG